MKYFWNRKKNTLTDESGDVIEMVACEECKCLLQKSDAYLVTEFLSMWGNTERRWFCKMHKKPYDQHSVGYSKSFYSARLEVSEDGTPIGYTKIKEK